MKTIQSEADTTSGFTIRMLLSLVAEVAAAQASVASITAQISALATEYDVKLVDPETL